MTSLGNYLRRNYEPLLLSVQVFIDLGVLQFACWTTYALGVGYGLIDPEGLQAGMYTQVFALVCAICLICFNGFGLYRPAKSLLNMDEFKGILKSTVVAYFVFFTLVLLLQPTRERPENNPIVDIFNWIDLPFQPENFSRLAMHVTFALIVVFMTISRFASFKYIQRLHQRGIGNRNVLIYGAGSCGRILQRKFALVPTLGLNLLGFIEDAPETEGMTIGSLWKRKCDMQLSLAPFNPLLPISNILEESGNEIAMMNDFLESLLQE